MNICTDGVTRLENIQGRRQLTNEASDLQLHPDMCAQGAGWPMTVQHHHKVLAGHRPDLRTEYCTCPCTYRGLACTSLQDASCMFIDKH